MTTAQKVQRLVKPYKKTELCKTAGINPLTLANLTNERKQPTLATVKKLAAALGVDPFWILDDAKPWPPVRVGRPTTDEVDDVNHTQACSAA